MSLVFAGVCSHAPGITGRKDRADPVVRDAFYASYDRMRQAIEDAHPDALVVIGAEHFANFFMPMLANTPLTDDSRFLLIYNFTPAQSVSVVDVPARKFEIGRAHV